MPNYNNGKIYTVRFRDNDKLIYIGSTTQNLSMRYGGHKRDTKCSLHQYLQEYFNNDWSNCYIELYENYCCNSKEELNRKEGEIMRMLKENENYILINKHIAGRTKSEYYKDNIEAKKIYDKEYFKEYYTDQVKEKKKKYREDNKDKIKDYLKKYWEMKKLH